MWWMILTRSCIFCPPFIWAFKKARAWYVFHKRCTRSAFHTGPCNGLPRGTCPHQEAWTSPNELSPPYINFTVNDKPDTVRVIVRGAPASPDEVYGSQAEVYVPYDEFVRMIRALRLL